MSNLIENGPCRETAVGALRSRGERLMRQGRQLIALANQLDEIQISALYGIGEGEEGKHPYVGVGSDAEEALWELVVSYRG